MRGGILDCRCARRSARRQVGTKGWSVSDRTKGWALELNSTALAYHAQFAELDAHNCFGAAAAAHLRSDLQSNSARPNPQARGTSAQGQLEKTFHRDSTAGLPSTADLVTDGRHRRSV